jgi:hypothetical protein
MPAAAAAGQPALHEIVRPLQGPTHLSRLFHAASRGVPAYVLVTNAFADRA